VPFGTHVSGYFGIETRNSKSPIITTHPIMAAIPTKWVWGIYRFGFVTIVAMEELIVSMKGTASATCSFFG